MFALIELRLALISYQDYYMLLRTLAAVFWTGKVSAGTHSAWLQSPTPDTWGCGDKGVLRVLVLPAVPGLVRGQAQVHNSRAGC